MFSGKMCTSSATSAPSRWPTVVVPMNLPLAMSATLAFVIPITTKLSASVTFMRSPLRAFTVRFLPSSDSTVPRILTGGLAGAWAAATVQRAASRTAAMVRIMVVSLSINRAANAEMREFIPGSVDARAGDLHHARHLREVGAQQRVERIGAERARLDALLGEAIEDQGILEQRRHRGIDLLDDGFRHAGRPEQAEPGIELVARRAALGEGRQIGEEPRAL